MSFSVALAALGALTVIACRGTTIKEAAVPRIDMPLDAACPAGSCRPDPPDAPGQTPSNHALAHIPLIAESDFVALLSARRARPAASPRQIAAMELAAMANATGAARVAGRVQRGVRVSSDIFVVARDVTASPTGVVASRRFFIAAVQLSGNVSWAASSPALLRESGAAGRHTALHGCVPIGRRSNLPDGIRLNAESSVPLTSATFEPVEVHLFGEQESSTQNRFLCAGSIRVTADPGAPAASRPVPAFKSSLALPPDAILMSEAAFHRAIAGLDTVRRSSDAKAAAARIATASHAPSALGIDARIVRGGRFSTSLIVVARDPEIEQARVRAAQFYLAPIDLTGTADWIGAAPVLGFSSDLPTVDLSTSFCGPVATPGAQPNCGAGLCIDAPHPWIASGAGIGGGAAPGGSRVTIRLLELVGGQFAINVLACTRFLTPPERQPSNCGAPGGGLRSETCNGRDDDCNGLVDDGRVCDLVPVACPAPPRTCGNIRCGEIPDGRGGVIQCGPPCR